MVHDDGLLGHAGGRGHEQRDPPHGPAGGGVLGQGRGGAVGEEPLLLEGDGDAVGRPGLAHHLTRREVATAVGRQPRATRRVHEAEPVVVRWWWWGG